MITFKAIDSSGEIINSALSPFTFPDGQAFTKREDRRELESTEIAVIQPSAFTLNDDLFQLAMWNDYITHEIDHNWEKVKRVLVLPYMPGARSDRGTPYGLRIYADFIAGLGLDQIIVFDPHSPMTGDRLHAAANDLTIVHSDELFLQRSVTASLPEYTGIIAPDKGAKDRAGRIADLLELPIITATKERNPETGKLSNFIIDLDDKDGRYLIVDDICDGGGTFCGLAEASGLDRENLDLFVSHGIFSKNAYFNLSKHFGSIFTTNSYIPTEPAPEFFYSRGARIRKAADFHSFDVIRLLISKINN